MRKLPTKIIEWEDAPYTTARGWLVIDSLINGVCGGGTFMHENCSLMEVCDTAHDMTYKNLLNPIPFGGAKAGIQYAPDKSDSFNVLSRFLIWNKNILNSVFATGADLNIKHMTIENIVRDRLNLISPFSCLGKMYSEKLGIPDQSEQMNKLLKQPVNNYFDLVGAATGYVLSAIISHLANREPIRLVIQGFGVIGCVFRPLANADSRVSRTLIPISPEH